MLSSFGVDQVGGRELERRRDDRVHAELRRRALDEGVATQPTNGAAWYDVTRQGLLVYLAGVRVEAPSAQFSWEGPGRPAEALENMDGHFTGGVRLSGNLKRAIASVVGANDKLWLVDLEQRNATPLTAGGGNDGTGLLSPDERWLLFSSDRAGGGHRFYRAPLDGSTPPAPWIEVDGRVHSLTHAANMVGLTLE